MNLVSIERTADDGLSGAWWQFWFDGDGTIPTIVLHSYFEWTRATRRHRERVNLDREYHRHFDVKCKWHEAAREGRGWLLPLPEDVIAEARITLSGVRRHTARARRVMEARIVAPTQADIDRIRETGR